MSSYCSIIVTQLTQACPCTTRLLLLLPFFRKETFYDLVTQTGFMGSFSEYGLVDFSRWGWKCMEKTKYLNTYGLVSASSTHMNVLLYVILNKPWSYQSVSLKIYFVSFFTSQSIFCEVLIHTNCLVCKEWKRNLRL